MTAAEIIAGYLYLVGWCWMYAMATLWLPITCSGPTRLRFLVSFFWPMVGLLAVEGLLRVGFDGRSDAEKKRFGR